MDMWTMILVVPRHYIMLLLTLRVSFAAGAEGVRDA